MSDPVEMLEPDDNGDAKAKPQPQPASDNPFVQMVRNPAARTYLLVSGGGLVVAALGMTFLNNSLGGGVALLLTGVMALALRWPAGPPLFVVALSYFLFFPLGLPIEAMGRGSKIPAHHFDFIDLIVTAAGLVHLIAAYRFHAVMRAGMPFDAPAPFVKPGAKPTVRPPEPVRDAELWFLFARVGLVVLAGQLVWLFVTKLKVDFGEDFPLRFYDNYLEEQGERYGQWWTANSLSRFLLTVGVMVGGGFALWFVMWYWRLATMNRDEARASCLDQEWATARREYNRPEKWRGWMKQKLAGTLPRKGCGAWFLVVGVPLILFTLFAICLGCMGAYR
jgi:hypothetical protein